MEIVGVQLTESARSVINKSFLSSDHFDMSFEKVEGVLGVRVTDKKKGSYWLPMSSISWCRTEGKTTAKRGRPKKVGNVEAA
tara:strand:+ start:412 stop:657 length:246 start_codon:yes stop_codon:yes gene_type:complete